MDEEKNKIDVGQEVSVKENAVKKKVVRKKKTSAKKASEKTITRKKRPGGKKKTAKRRGRPRAVKSLRRRGAAKKTGLITLPINKDTDVAFWSRMIAFLNEKKNKSFVIHLDGKTFSLGTD